MVTVKLGDMEDNIRLVRSKIRGEEFLLYLQAVMENNKFQFIFIYLQLIDTGNRQLTIILGEEE